jgi:hypothetical protein
MLESSVNLKPPSIALIQIISAITAVDVNLKVLGRCFAIDMFLGPTLTLQCFN